MPTVEEFFRRLEEDYLYILLPERKKKVANFIRTARKVSQLYELDITIKKHVGHISAEFCFDASPCLKYLLDVIRLADDITFFANIRGYEIISGDNAGYYALSNTEVTTSAQLQRHR